LITKLPYTGTIVQRRNLEFENQQRHHNGEYAIAERFDSAEPQVALAETF
jgi:hypothetical protein